MDITGVKSINESTYTSKNDTKKANTKDSVAEKNEDKAQNLGTDKFVKSTEDTSKPSTYKPIKNKLSTDEITALKENEQNSKAELIKKFINDTISNQNKLLGKSTESGIPEMSKSTSDLLTKIFGSVENAYPPLSTTPEAAQKAISEGGPYSVNAVADRIMTMAKALAGDDPNKLQQMRAAVEKEFKEAGFDFKKATNSDLPQICQDTCKEVMRRFDELQSKVNSNNDTIKSDTKDSKDSK
ncbi:hypothetical protein [Clostridium scatologenes]|uniref:Uncharacterized protein n=1 Tax=Clostridium scatologenes TaxID=1548 RepID=A0A0E3M885_CLOSL|nr:hypothetical protein [Clostridium scatologenes]AKA67997.1 hypothetical protein CSCA_0872 [Clostridium scatologenes]